MLFSRLLAVTTALPFFCSAAPVHEKRSFEPGPLISSNFPDPSYIQVDGTYYAFATSNGEVNVQVATSTDFQSWTLLNVDALPQTGSWSNGQAVWAPNVVQLASGSFVLYYAAEVASDTSTHCLGAATSSNIEGPYEPSDNTFACPTEQGGAIDASGFQDADGTMYVVYKIDGNSIGHGGSCNNGVEPIVPTPIMLQQVESDGMTPVGSAQQILVNGQYDGPLVEAPSLSRIADSSSAGGQLYILFFSSNCYSSSYYDVSYAYSTNGIFNGGQDYTKSSAPLLTTGADNNQLYAPGGMASPFDLGASGDVLFHADLDQSADTRQLWGGSVSVDIGSRTVSI